MKITKYDLPFKDVKIIENHKNCFSFLKVLEKEKSFSQDLLEGIYSFTGDKIKEKIFEKETSKVNLERTKKHYTKNNFLIYNKISKDLSAQKMMLHEASKEGSSLRTENINKRFNKKVNEKKYSEITYDHKCLELMSSNEKSVDIKIKDNSGSTIFTKINTNSRPMNINNSVRCCISNKTGRVNSNHMFKRSINKESHKEERDISGDLKKNVSIISTKQLKENMAFKIDSAETAILSDDHCKEIKFNLTKIKSVQLLQKKEQFNENISKKISKFIISNNIKSRKLDQKIKKIYNKNRSEDKNILFPNINEVLSNEKIKDDIADPFRVKKMIYVNSFVPNSHSQNRRQNLQKECSNLRRKSLKVNIFDIIDKSFKN